MRESEFQSRLIKKLERLYPGCLILKNDPNYLQGILDLVIFYRDRYAFLEVKRTAKSSVRPNQRYYVERINEMSFASFIDPSNEEEVLHELEKALRP